MNFIRFIWNLWQAAVTQVRLIKPRLFGLRVGRRVLIGPSVNWPLFSLRRLSIGNGVIIGSGVQFFIPAGSPGRIEIGDETCIGHGCVISAIGSVKIGYGCQISYDAHISDFSHVFGKGKSKPVTIGDRCYVGRTCTILPGVNLPDGSLVECMTVVRPKS